jgi:hypothetical protein
MKIRNYLVVNLIIIFVICSSITCIGYEENQNLDYDYFNEIKEIFEFLKNYRSNILWFPGFLITLILAPFIIIYLIIAIILDIGNP